MDQSAKLDRLLPAVLIGVTLATACDTAPLWTLTPRPGPTPAPAPTALGYRVSGVALDAVSGTPVANATIMLRHNQGVLTTESDGHGAYVFAFETDTPYRPEVRRGPVDGLALLLARDAAYWGDIAGGYWTAVQLLPLGATDIRHDLRLRPIVAVPAGQSLGLAVEADSSLPWDPDWDPWTFTSYEALSEHFLVSVQTEGILTIAVRTEADGVTAKMTCRYVGCPSWFVQDSVSIPVRADRSPYIFSVEVPRGRAPQRYQVETSFR